MAAAQLAALRERKVDFMLARLPESLPDDVEAERLYSEPSLVVAGVGSVWARRRKIAFADLIDEPWALPAPDTQVGAIFSQAFRQGGFDYPKRNVAYGSVHLHVTLAASGQFLAILPGSLLRFNEVRFTLKVLPVTSPVPAWPVGIVTRRGAVMQPAAKLFVEIARDVAKAFDSD